MEYDYSFPFTNSSLNFVIRIGLSLISSISCPQLRKRKKSINTF